MRASITLLAVGAALTLSPPAAAQVTDTAAAIERVRQELQSGRITPEEVRARIRAAGISDEEIRRRLRELGYPENLLDQYLGTGVATGVAPTLSGAAVEDVLRRLSIPPVEQPPLPDSLLLLGDTADIRLSQPPADEATLQVFGKSLFERATSQFRPVTMGPVPPNYRLGPGDELVLILTGDVQAIYNLPVTREGFVVIPEVGRVPVNGLTMEALRNALYTYLGRVYSGVIRGPEATTHFEVSIATLRRNQVFVIGEVEQPAAYEVISVATALQALYQAGGPTDVGSFRNIEVRRGDRVVAALDIYEYLTGGAAAGDIALDQGDVIFVPVRGRHVTLAGNVVRPAIYELKGNEGLRALLDLAGGIVPEADLRRVQIDRILPPEERQPGVARRIFDVNVAELLDAEGELIPLVAGDRVHVHAVPEKRRNTVTVLGNIWSPGVYELAAGMRLSDLIDRAGGLKDDTYLGRVQIVRVDPEDLSTRIVSASLAAEEDPALREYDEVRIYSVADFRDRRFVTIYGEVQKPGVYEFRDDMSLKDLVILAGGLRDNAYVLEAEVARLSDRPDTTGDLTELRTVPLDSSYVISEWGARPGSDGGDGQAAAPDFVLRRYDNVFIRPRPGWELQRTVTLSGEVRFPGAYALQRKDERLSSVVERAGGLTGEAYPEGVRFFRAREFGRGRGDFVADSLEMAGKSRVNVDLPRALSDPGGGDNLILQDGDSVHIPEYIPMVRVEGAVLFPVTVQYEPGAGLGYYIENAGGYARYGDSGRTRVEYANGSVKTVSRFLIFKSAPTPGPGSRVFVPVKPEGEPINWQAITAMITTAVAVYAVLTR